MTETHEQAVKRGKKSKRDGGNFEKKVRKDLESKGWTVAKWTNNVEFDFCKCKDNISNSINECRFCKKQFEYGATRLEAGKLVPAKHKFNPFNKVMTIGTGFPDFITFKKINLDYLKWKNTEGNGSVEPSPSLLGENYNISISDKSCPYSNIVKTNFSINEKIIIEKIDIIKREDCLLFIFGKQDKRKNIPFKDYEVIGVEAKSNGYLTKEEKEKCKWLLDNKIFSRILIAKKGEKGEIIYINFEDKK